MRRLWLLFAQTVTVCLGILFIVSTLRPDWLPLRPAPGQSPAAVVAPSGLSAAQGGASYSAAVASAAPAVVNIYTTKQVVEPILPLLNDPDLARLFNQLPGFSRSRKTTALGSGVVVDSAGYILTNYHVVEAADEIEIALNDGRQAKARLIGADPETDLAVLKTDLKDVPAIGVDDQQRLAVGDVVLAIGNPFGVGQTTTLGIVSALGRNRLGINMYENFIQTDAAINPGNSGGALIDTSGRLVGINTAIYSETGGSLGIGFAIPAGVALNVKNQIIRQGYVTRGWIGVEPQDITPDLARAFGLPDLDGVIIAGVLRQGPGARSGLTVGDIVVAINDERVRDTLDFLGKVARLAPGKSASFKVVRGGKSLMLDVRVAQRPQGRRG
ncbi:S1C family serine protease [Pusillimonas minor]|uniref:Trypsin-like peptidase domain-containing protein n=1 Tax=Pusillimonas minor TaxID=2697024 RepID=A0A842HJQ7_9BURK|nr:trypsin-like peptidase domain-containing protein [Pusillimonas minor]MBC2768909.1 trypsin-like peptidase domain-containing protein [Pusillimonas minor]